MIYVAIIGAIGGLAGVTALARLIWIEPKVARQDEIKMLWNENRQLRVENTERDGKIYNLQLQVLECERDKNVLADRVAALEAR